MHYNHVHAALETGRFLPVVSKPVPDPSNPLPWPSGADMPSRAITDETNPNAQFIVVGDNLIPVGSADELHYYVAAGLVLPGDPIKFPHNYFVSLQARLNVLDK
jgi:hypothetical protein